MRLPEIILETSLQQGKIVAKVIDHATAGPAKLILIIEATAGIPEKRFEREVTLTTAFKTELFEAPVTNQQHMVKASLTAGNEVHHANPVVLLLNG
ncbi:MAG: hypothetical protein ACK417_01220 [Bacteroidia bacterium]